MKTVATLSSSSFHRIHTTQSVSRVILSGFMRADLIFLILMCAYICDHFHKMHYSVVDPDFDLTGGAELVNGVCVCVWGGGEEIH